MLTQTTQTNRNVEKQIDTITKVVTDSSMLRLWLECDSVGKIKIGRLQQTNSILQSMIFNLQNNILDIESKSQTVYRDRTHTVYDTVVDIQKTEVAVPGPERVKRGALWWWQSILLWTGVLYCIRTTLKIAFNWHSLTFKKLLNII